MAASLGVILALSGCVRSPARNDLLRGRTNLVIGFTASMSGPRAEDGKRLHDGYQLWADRVNAAGGLRVGSRSLQITLKSYDDGSDAANAAALIRQMIVTDRADFLIGPDGGPATVAAGTVAERYRRIFVATDRASHELLALGYHYIVGSAAQDSAEVDAATGFLAQQSPRPRLAIVAADDATSHRLARAAEAQAKQKGLEVVDTAQISAGGDAGELLAGVSDRGAEALLAIVGVADMQRIAARSAPLRPAATIQVVTPAPPASPTAAGLAPTNQFIANPCSASAAGFGDRYFGSSAEFAKAYHERFGSDPGVQGSLGYAGAEVLGLAIQKAGDIDQTDVLAALHRLDVTTICGPFRVDGAGTNVGGLAVLDQVQVDRLVAVYPPAHAAAQPIYPAK